MNWPEEVKILSSKDICYKTLDDGPKACLMGWWVRTFKECTIREDGQIGKAMRSAMKEIDPAPWGTIPYWNDSHTLAECAKAWNLAMFKLGYTEGNPQ